MDSIRIIEGQARYAVAAVVLLVATLAAALVPMVAAAAQITERSITLSNSSAAMENVSYQLNFTPAEDAGALVVEFCSNSPLISQSCTAPTGLTTTSVGVSTSGFTASSAAANRVTVVGTLEAETAAEIELTGITNPTAADTLYVRMVTYANNTAAGGYPANITAAGIDEGGVAVAITDTVGVSGAVLESLAFCVSREEIGADCAVEVGSEPTLRLGDEISPGVFAMQPGDVNEGSVYTQISTNAVNGAVVRLKSNAVGCGGLLRAGAPAECDILPAGETGTVTGENARFGIKLGTAYATTGVTTAVGTVRAAANSPYTTSDFRFRYNANNSTGVTSVYGDELLDTNSEPANNQNMQLTFGASVTNNTPAGLYSTDLSLVATGRF